MKGGGGGYLAFRPKNGPLRTPARREEEGAFTAIIAARQIAAMAVMAASLPCSSSCEEIMSLASQQDSVR